MNQDLGAVVLIQFEAPEIADFPSFNERVKAVEARGQKVRYLNIGDPVAFGFKNLPPGKYRVEAYRGFLHKPAFQEFTLAPRSERRVELRLQPMHETGWLSGDDHIHLTRAPEDDDVFRRETAAYFNVTRDQVRGGGQVRDEAACARACGWARRLLLARGGSRR